ncbi:MAG: matrixin family metalloprotease [Bryobacteraceae bacterium]
MRGRIWAAMAAVALLVAAGPAQAYYHYIYYASRTGNFTPIPAQFNLAALPNNSNTINIFVDDNGPSTFYPNDTFGSVLGEVKAAAAAWNAVPNSALRVVFGGLETAGQAANTPGVEVEFSELPPGLLGLGTPNLPATPTLTTVGAQTFVAIERGVVMLSNNTNLGSGPSSTEQYFTTAVHEIGHALGLQHTWTASAMSQATIRNTDRSRPIDADDIASLLVLYGNANWQQNYWSASGRVQLSNGAGVSLASVVAIPEEGPAVSTLTDPNGYFTIQGLPPGNSYQFYVHPLPPDALASTEGLLLPSDLSGLPFSPSAPFTANFFGGLISPQGSPSWSGSVSGLTFVVQPRSAVTAYDLETLSYLDPVGHTYAYQPPANAISLSPAFETISQAELLVYSQGDPSGGGSSAVPQSLTLLGGFSPAVSCASDGAIAPCFIPYQNTVGSFNYFVPPASPGAGPRHLVYTYANDMFVLPDAVVLVNNGPPYINSVAGNADGSVTVTGGNFGPDSRVFFDGLLAVATLSSPSSAAAGAIAVTPPPSSNGQVSTVAVYNSDGQNSSFYVPSGGNAPTYNLPASGTPTVIVNPAPQLAAGSSALFNIIGFSTHFVSGQVTVGFGSSDVTVNDVWVLSPTLLAVNVSVAPGAALGSTEISVISGYQVITMPGNFQILPANPSLPVIGAVVNGAGLEQPLAPGSFATIYGANLTPFVGAPLVALNGATTQLLYWSNGQINFVVPGSLATGQATLTLINGAASVNYGVAIANQPPTILNVADVTNPASTPGPGDIMTVQVAGLNPAVLSNPSRVQATVSGVAMPLYSLAAGQIQFVLDQSFAGSPVPIAIVVDGAASLPYTTVIR